MSARHVSTKAKVFVSHSHEDRHKAVELQRVLEEHQARTFLDQDTIDTLDNLPNRVREGISWCDSLLLIWSVNAADSAWVRREWETAHKRGKKIVPYVLDGTPLPYLLDELVYIPASDAQHGHAKLLKAVIGPVVVDPRTLFPGLWAATVDAFGMAQGTYTLELRENGQVEGEGGISDSGMAGQLANEMGMSGLLSMRVPLHGSWSYDRGSKTLTIETTTSVVFGQQQSDTIRIRTTGHEKGAITGEDLAGRQWTLRRIGDRSRSPVEDERQRIRDGLQNMIDTSRDSPALAVMLAALCVGAQEQSEFNLGLPTKKARRVMQADQNTLPVAFENLVQALERGGWIH
ncbi:MAG: toll/interleukin-1 receptor domain-containing protein [Woeseiaceae bacterium]|nr:toll/interleukin-1 receptor domain-containing protein [Woeseiaceae bacterium]